MNSNFKYKKISNFVICISVVSIALAITGTYSYFSKSNKYNVTGSVVNWSFSANNSVKSFTQTLDDIVPGNSGSFSIALNASNSTTDVECSIIPVISSELAGMILYSDEEHTKKITEEEPLVQIVAAGTSSNATIYWVWEYDTGTLTGSNISFSVNVIGRQVVS